MSVSAAATMPPVQDSAVASLRWAALQAARTSPAFAVSIASDKAEPHEQEKRETRVERGEDIVEHDAESAMHLAVRPVRREGLDDVGDAEEHEAGGIGERRDRRDGEDEELRRDLVDDDEAGIADIAGPARGVGRPAAQGEDNCRGDDEAERAEFAADMPGEGQGGERPPGTGDLRQQPGAE